MRIRKHAQKLQISCLPVPFPFPYNESLRRSPSMQDCKLNQSPWDVMSYPSEEMRDDSEVETAGAVEGIHSLNGTCEEEYKLEKKEILCSSSTALVVDKGRKRKRTNMKSKVMMEGGFAYCNKTDGKGWKCKREAKRGQSLCEHHLGQMKSYYTNRKVSSDKKFTSDRAQSSAATLANKVCHQKRPCSSKMPSSDYYYYTGFGPLWGKGRAEATAKAQTENRDEEFNPGNSASTRESSSDHEEGDAGMEENSDDNGNAGQKKRDRVKTRSLKSLL